MEDRHEREKQLWAEMKLQYEARAQGHTAKINALKKSLDELRAKTNMGPERIRTLLHTHRGNFEHRLTEALAKGWAGWAQQAAELHTFRADHENRTKAGKGFFKLSNESIAAVREDLAADYQALADRHSEEVVQILEEYGTAELEIARQLQENEADRLALGRQTIETVELPDNPREEAEPKPQEEPVATTSAPPVSESTAEETPNSAPILVPDTTALETPLPTTTTAQPQPESCPTATMEPPAQPDNDSNLDGANTRSRTLRDPAHE